MKDPEVLHAPWRALLVDDERLARSRMRRLLSAHSPTESSQLGAAVEVVAEAANVAQAAAALRAAEQGGEAIDVVFLDVQMPGPDGFALFDACEVKCHVVFVTAFGEHALRAFEVNALDYLVKPVAPERLAACLARLGKRAIPSGLLVEEDKVHIEADGMHRFVPVRDVLGVRAAGDYTEVLLADGTKPWTRLSLSTWAERLGETQYMRIHRGAIVRLAAVDALDKEDGGVVLRAGDHTLPVSRRTVSALRRRLRAMGSGSFPE